MCYVTEECSALSIQTEIHTESSQSRHEMSLRLVAGLMERESLYSIDVFKHTRSQKLHCESRESYDN